MINIKNPTKQEFDETNKFRTYLNYIGAISNFLDKIDSKKFVSEIAESTEFLRIQCKGLNDPFVDKLLRNSWLTEIKLHVDADDKSFVSYSNHWAPVQSYYATYLALRAYFISSANSIPSDHTANLTAIGEEIKRRPGLFPVPFRTICIDNSLNPSSFINLPNGISIDGISSLQSYKNADFWNFYTLLLRTTHYKKLEKKCADWKSRKKKKRMPSKVKKVMKENLGITSVFDFYYRIRLRSNYEDADSFLLSIQSEEEAQEFNRGLRIIVWYSLLLFETLIAKNSGIANFEKIVADFLKYDKTGIGENTTIGKRREVICSQIRKAENARAKNLASNNG